MAGAISGATGSTANAASQLLSPTPKDIAAQLLSEHKAGRGYNMPELRRAYDQIAVNNPNQAQAIRGALDNMLSSRDRTAFAQAEYKIKAPDGGTLTLKEGAPSLAEYRASPKASDREHYLRLERNFGGDGLHRTNESAKVEANYFAYVRSGMGYEQFRAVQDTQATALANKDSAEFQALAGDLFQMGLDIGGIFDPTGALDAVSGGISLYKGEYFDAFMSGLALVPVIGGLAILGRLGKFGETINKAIDLAKSSPLARDMLMPALEDIHGILNKIPDAALRAMPDSGRKALEGIKTRLDNVLGRTANDVPPPRPAMVNGRHQHYFDASGKKGAWNDGLNAKLSPNADYHVNGYKFATDAKGRIASVEGQLTLSRAERSGYQQGVAGREDRLSSDEGGHLIASIFNGPGEAVNLKAMNGSFNRTEFRNLERTLEDALKADKKVHVKIDVIHSGDSARPDKFIVTHSIDGVKSFDEFLNKAGG